MKLRLICNRVKAILFSAIDEPRKVPSVAGCSENHYGLLLDNGTPKSDAEGKTISIPHWVSQAR